MENNTQPTPLYLMLLGTAGSGKTTATQTMLQDLQELFKAIELTSAFCRVAAPTGTAAFNVRFNATTIHRLIKWFNPRFFQAPTHPERLAELQAHFDYSQLIVIDEVSMVGRQMMGPMDSRLQQAVADANPRGDVCGGFSFVCVGDPAQCQALFDQQLYDLDPHPDTHRHR